TLGLDILYRRQFYDSLLNDYFDHRRTILVTTHQVEEVQHILTDVLFFQHGSVRDALCRSDGRAREPECRPGIEARLGAAGLRSQRSALRRARTGEGSSTW